VTSFSELIECLDLISQVTESDATLRFILRVNEGLLLRPSQSSAATQDQIAVDSSQMRQYTTRSVLNLVLNGMTRNSDKVYAIMLLDLVKHYEPNPDEVHWPPRPSFISLLAVLYLGLKQPDAYLDHILLCNRELIARTTKLPTSDDPVPLGSECTEADRIDDCMFS